MFSRICIYFSRQIVIDIYDLLILDTDKWEVRRGDEYHHGSGIYIWDFLGLNVIKPAAISLTFFENYLLRKGVEFMKDYKTRKVIAAWNDKTESSMEL